MAANELLYVRLAKRAQAAGGGGVELVSEFACECSHWGCRHRLAMTAAEYEPIRASSALFVVAPGQEHFDAAAEEVITEQTTHWVVERTPSLETHTFFTRGGEVDPSGSSLDGESESRVETQKLAIVPSQDRPRDSSE